MEGSITDVREIMQGVLGFGCSVDLDDFLEENSLSSFSDILDALEGMSLIAFVSKNNDRLFLIDPNYCQVVPKGADQFPLPTTWLTDKSVSKPESQSDFLELTDVEPGFQFFAARKTIETAIEAFWEDDPEEEINRLIDLVPTLEADNESEDHEEEEDLDSEPLPFGPIVINELAMNLATVSLVN